MIKRKDNKKFAVAHTQRRLFMHRPEHKMLRIWKYAVKAVHGSCDE